MFTILLSIFGWGAVLVNLLDDDNDSESADSEEISIGQMPLDVEGIELVGDETAETLQGDAGDDRIQAAGGDDVVLGEAGNDALFGGEDNDRIDGGPDDDKLFGGNGIDELIGGPGDDTLRGDRGGDILIGGDGSDELFGGQGEDVLVGAEVLDENALPDASEDPLTLDDILANIGFTEANPASDTLEGGTRDDVLILGSADTGSGGDGADRFAVGDWIGDGGPAVISDYDPDEDVILFAYEETGSEPNLTATQAPDGAVTIFADGREVAQLPNAPAGFDISDVQLAALAGATV